MKKYQIIYADPPWKYYSDRPCFEIDPITHNRGGASSKYSTMALDDIKNLPIRSFCLDDCTLFLWVTFPKLQEGLDTIKAWGFEYKTCAFVWVKTNRKSMGYFMGMGRWTRSNAELCLLATKGTPHRVGAGISQLILSSILEHSHKPTIVRERIVQLMGDLPRIELFARRKVEGWDAWGNEVESDIEF